jgi:sugar phosphate isomerase/epimerase
MPDASIDRRDAIRRLAALAATPFARHLGNAPDRIGLALYTVRELAARDFEGTLRAIAGIGYRDLDMYIYASNRDPRATRAMLDRVGLTCRSARVATPALYRGWERFVEAANVLGARWITLANVSPEERLSMRDWEELAVVFNRAGELARQAGLTFCYHNHDFELHPLEGRIPLDVMLGATDPELVRLQMDVYWMMKGGRNAVEEIRRLGSRVATLHLKDMDGTPRRGITTVGRGTIDFASVLRAAKTVKIADVFVEEDSPADPLAAARQSFAHLARLTNQER